MPVDIWGFESQLYAAIDAAGMKGKTYLREKFELGEDEFAEVRISSKTSRVLQNSMIVYSNDLDFAANFWERSHEPWFRIDNDKNQMHLHLTLDDGRIIVNHAELPEGETLSQLLSDAFEICKNYLGIEGVKIEDSEPFHGFSSGKIKNKN